ncbi:hypothetical protein GUF45_09245, partial [Xanthomonas citri pv. citri]|nr:hypothetical protein [Xanthomonas citri pv. citri]
MTDSRTSVVQLNNLHRMAMKRTGTHGDFDGDMGHYLEEKLEKEVGLLRKFSNLYTNLEKMSKLGLAQHIFDKSLS